MRHSIIVLAILAVSACGNSDSSIPERDVTDFATRYASTWSSQNPDELASFYEEDGRLIVNAGTPSVGRDQISATAGSYMEAFPDMHISLDSLVVIDESHAEFHWRWTGTNSGPGGNGNSVDLTGYEAWTFGPNDLIQVSDGHFDESEYARQMEVEEEY